MRVLLRGRSGANNRLFVELARFILPGGQTHDVIQAQALIETIESQAVLADEGYDADALLDCLGARKAKPVIPPKANRKEQRAFDRHQYRNRNGIERLFARPKQFRRIATRYDEPASRFESFSELAASMLSLQ